MRVIKSGGVPANATNAPTEKENGEYALVLTTTEMNSAFVTIEGSSVTSKTYVVPVRLATRASEAATIWDADPDAHATAGTFGLWLRQARQKLLGKANVVSATGVETVYDTDDATSLGTMTHTKDATDVDRTQLS